MLQFQYLTLTIFIKIKTHFVLLRLQDVFYIINRYWWMKVYHMYSYIYYDLWNVTPDETRLNTT